MNLDYELPPRLIAQHPADRRDASRLMVLDRAARQIHHAQFADLPQFLRAGDRLVVNDTRVLPARLIGTRASTGGQWEGLFVREVTPGVWEMLAQTGGKPRPGEVVEVTGTPLRLRLRERVERAWLVEPLLPGSPAEILHRYGQIPLPPYIRKGREAPEDRERYQTVFARHDGSIAAPTAGLHFTPGLFATLQSRGVERSAITLHVGLGTFEPIRGDDPLQHAMHREWCQVGESATEEIRQTRERGGRVVAVGTTSVRTLETAARGGTLVAGSWESDLYIHPPYRFQVVDALITNFHLPRTTLLLLVAALAGEGMLREAYRLAVEQEYRFYSYGDAMLIV